MLPLHEGIVYGPVHSRRLGWSLGVNLMPRGVKLCSFNCSYCQYGWTRSTVRPGRPTTDAWPAPAAVVRSVGLALERLAAQRVRLAYVTLAGNGEPTLHPQFPEVVSALRAFRDDRVPSLKLAILSNASTLGEPRVVDALEQLDERFMKLDAGDPAVFRRINNPGVALEEVVEGLARLHDFTLQTMFVKDRLGRVDNTSDLAVALWIGQISRLKPRAVHVYTIDRDPAWPYLQPVPWARLEEIARRARAAGLDVRVFPATAHAPVAAGR